MDNNMDSFLYDLIFKYICNMKTKEKIEHLTPEQEAMVSVYVKEYTNKFFTYKPIDKEKAIAYFQWVYQFSELEPFKELYIVSNPREAQKLANQLCETEGVHYPFAFAKHEAAWDLGEIAMNAYFSEVLEIEFDENWHKFKEIADLGVYDCIQFDEAVIVVELPTSVHRKNRNLHCEDGPALSFGTDYHLYFWNGINVPEKLIMDKNGITKEDIFKETNGDALKCFVEILGQQKYDEILSQES